MLAQVKRTTLKVRDLDKSIPFYKDVLGMTKYYDDKITLSGDLLPGGQKGDVTRLVIMKGDDPIIGMIGLLQWIDPIPDAPEIDYTFDFGKPVFVAQVADVKQTYKSAKKFGSKMMAPLSESEYPGASGNIVRVRSVGVFDPDGHFFECNQRL